MSYSENYSKRLQSKYWLEKKLKIHIRDKFACRKCLNKEIIRNSVEGTLLQALEIDKEMIEGKHRTINKRRYRITFSDQSSCTVHKYYISIYFNHTRLTKSEKISVFYSASSIGSKIIIQAIVDRSVKNQAHYIYVRGLQAHHRYYYKNDRMPWSYPDKALVTLCEKCHDEIH